MITNKKFEVPRVPKVKKLSRRRSLLISYYNSRHFRHSKLIS